MSNEHCRLSGWLTTQMDEDASAILLARLLSMGLGDITALDDENKSHSFLTINKDT